MRTLAILTTTAIVASGCGHLPDVGGYTPHHGYTAADVPAPWQPPPGEVPGTFDLSHAPPGVILLINCQLGSIDGCFASTGLINRRSYFCEWGGRTCYDTGVNGEVLPLVMAIRTPPRAVCPQPHNLPELMLPAPCEGAE